MGAPRLTYARSFSIRMLVLLLFDRQLSSHSGGETPVVQAPTRSSVTFFGDAPGQVEIAFVVGVPSS